MCFPKKWLSHLVLSEVLPLLARQTLRRGELGRQEGRKGAHSDSRSVLETRGMALDQNTLAPPTSHRKCVPDPSGQLQEPHTCSVSTMSSSTP
ncbi:hypothetical protein Cadr_000029252 [Camelus dromedarius]|uniref:Uncharacterized protein n=1 Tax=Camelus dromedarius TaxID=9838 RepID=A0A5N4C6K6_CAMDR|nr:hypothetical protein Cadr_000029252 [Camelus dromedarius]